MGYGSMTEDLGVRMWQEERNCLSCPPSLPFLPPPFNTELQVLCSKYLLTPSSPLAVWGSTPPSSLTWAVATGSPQASCLCMLPLQSSLYNASAIIVEKILKFSHTLLKFLPKSPTYPLLIFPSIRNLSFSSPFHPLCCTAHQTLRSPQYVLRFPGSGPPHLFICLSPLPGTPTSPFPEMSPFLSRLLQVTPL